MTSCLPPLCKGGDDVEEFGLDGFDARQELDIVDEQHADV